MNSCEEETLWHAWKHFFFSTRMGEEQEERTEMTEMQHQMRKTEQTQR